MSSRSPIRIFFGLLLLVGAASTTTAHAQEKSPDSASKDALIQSLFESTDLPSFEAAGTKARAAGIPEQAILEARFLLLVDLQDFSAIAKLDPVFEKQKERFRIQDSIIFSVPEEFFAICQYSKALGALEKDDLDGFKKHITEAFWLSPRQASAFAPHIENLRLKEAMANLKVDLTQSFARQGDGKDTTLATLTGESKHLLIHFWSPWSTQCQDSLPDFIAMSQTLTQHQIPVVSVLFDRVPEALKEAKTFRQAIKEPNVGEWIVDNFASPLSRELRVQDLPTVVLLSRNGSVLFNGYPSDELLWQTLAKVAPGIKRPQRQEPPTIPEPSPSE